MIYFLNDIEIVVYISRFDIKNIIIKVDDELENDMKDSEYTQKLAIIENLSFFFEDIDVWDMKQGIKAMKGVVCFL